jgi:succinate dehydrogenase / fumarate reductase membrane anchor subunit
MQIHGWAWLFQRISAVILFIVVGFHIWFLHFANLGEPLRYSDIVIRLNTPALISMDVLLLIFGLYHAVYGIYTIFLDFDSGEKERVIVFSIFVIIGLCFMGFGIFGFSCIVGAH